MLLKPGQYTGTNRHYLWIKRWVAILVEALLAELRSYSQLLIQDHPFPENDNPTLKTIQQNLQSCTGAESSFIAFDRFWSQDYLAQTSWQSEIEF